ncbi:MAG: helix-turn-helix domain-containing protein [Phycisphaerae bacterium]|nr:helix-turn-helix domain-containing protein [Phycisphaerae bacterium]
MGGKLVFERRLLRSVEAALVLGIHRSTLRSLAARGVLSPVLIGGIRRWRADEVERLVRGEAAIQGVPVPAIPAPILTA